MNGGRNASIMLNNYKLIIDQHCEVYDLLADWADGEFIEFGNIPIDPSAIYMVGRMQFAKNIDRIINLATNNQAKIVLSNPAEGSFTILGQIRRLGIEQLVKDKKILILGGGDMESEYPCISYDSFMVKILDYITNREAMKRTSEIYSKIDKPYDFLFLNGRTRPHRKYLLEYLKYNNLLDDALWTNLDTEAAHVRYMTYYIDHLDRMKDSMPVHYLPPEYEVDEYLGKLGTLPEKDEKFAKYHLFSNTWGEIYLKPEPYIDTYFSLVTETVFEYPYSFRTEKIWKPITIGHPWIAVASQGYYRDMRNLGFKTFGHLVDESFDDIANEQDRIERISEVVTDLLKQDLKSFLAAAEEVCKYNQQHLVEVRKTVKQEFPTRLSNFLSKYFNE